MVSIGVLLTRWGSFSKEIVMKDVIMAILLVILLVMAAAYISRSILCEVPSPENIRAMAVYAANHGEDSAAIVLFTVAGAVQADQIDSLADHVIPWTLDARNRLQEETKDG